MLIGTLGSTENKSPFKILMLVLFVLIEFIFMYKSKPAFTTDDFLTESMLAYSSNAYDLEIHICFLKTWMESAFIEKFVKNGALRPTNNVERST